jgi:Flp pilus assembly protein TadG
MNILFNKSAQRSQQGVVAILTALMIAVLIGMGGLTVDLGRLFIVRTEAQSAMDACALAAATQLAPGQNNALALTKAIAFGRAMSDSTAISSTGVARPLNSLNKVNFQSQSVVPANVSIKFSNALGGPYTDPGGAVTFNTAKYARCSYNVTGITAFFAGILGAATSNSIQAQAAATLSPAISVSAFPVAMCSSPTGNAGNNWGLIPGKWYGADNTGSSNGSYGTGNFGWIDFSTSGTTSGCGNSNGATELQCVIANPAATPTASIGTQVGRSGVINGVIDAWNTRFGIYSNAFNSTTAPPDTTGYAYTATNWPNRTNAYAGSPGGTSAAINYKAARSGHLGFQGAAASGAGIKSNTSPTSTVNHGLFGRIRRIVITPIVNCTVWAGGGSANPPIQDFSCALVLNPICQGTGACNPGLGNGFGDAKVEFIGLASAVNSPCAGSGLPGGTIGPLVPALVQ